MIKWGRLTTFIIIVVIILGVVLSTSQSIYKSIPLGLDLQGGFDVLYQVGDPGQAVSANDMNATIAALSNRVNSLGVYEPLIEVENGNRVRVDLAGQFNQEKARQFLIEQAVLQFK